MSLDGGCAFSVDADDDSSSESSDSFDEDPVIPIAPTLQLATHYNMNHPKRGLALIFNHEIFEDARLTRAGTNVDCENLRNTFKKFGFEIHVHENKTASDIKKILVTAAQMDHTDHDCLVTVVLSHGDRRVLRAHDTTYKIHHIWSNFTADKCPTLAGKPKMFFIQACRGTKLDAGATLRARTVTDGQRSNASQCFKIPVQADFLIVHSTVQGYYSFRNQETGTSFIDALCWQLNENGFKHDILKLLTFVLQRVALYFESYSSDPSMSQKKQMPCMTSMLTRVLKFPSSSNGNENGDKDIL